MGELIVNGIKTAFWVIISLAFMSAIKSIIGLIVQFMFTDGIIYDILWTASNFLPFNASVVFNAIGNATSAILAFMVANKIFRLSKSYI